MRRLALVDREVPMLWNKKIKKEMEDAASLEPAFIQLDLFSNRLDALRQTFNDNARELASIKPPPALTVVPTPIPANPMIPRPPPRAEGLYAINANTLKKPEPKRSQGSGRFYIQLGNTKDAASLSEMKDQLSKCGRVVDSGKGTASDPDASWMEIAVKREDTSSFIGKLEKLDVKDRVEKLIPVEPGEGRVQARQLDLFRAKQDSEAGV